MTFYLKDKLLLRNKKKKSSFLSNKCLLYILYLKMLNLSVSRDYLLLNTSTLENA